MLNRDFTKSNKEYFKKNRIVLIGIAVFLIIGVLVASIFGMKGNFEFTGYNEFSVTIGSTANVTTCKKEVENIVNSYNIGLDTILVMDEGDDKCLVVRYVSEIGAADKYELNTKIIDKLNVNSNDVSEHVRVEGVVRSTDYIYTAAIVLVLVAGASIFALFRYNGASAIAIIVSTMLGTLGYISLGAIFRLTIGNSYFAMILILNMLIIYACLDVLENIRSSSWIHNNDYSQALKTALNSSKFRIEALAISVFVAGLLFVLIAPVTVKYIALNIMFIPVAMLAVILYVLPFVWSVLITYTKVKKNNKHNDVVIEQPKEEN